MQIEMKIFKFLFSKTHFSIDVILEINQYEKLV